MGKFTPRFYKDGDQYVVPSPSLLFDTPEEAVAGGAAAGLQSGYGLSPTGESVELQDESNSFPGPFLIASVGNLRAWIVGGPTLDALVTDRNDAVEQLPEVRKDYGTKENPLASLDDAFDAAGQGGASSGE